MSMNDPAPQMHEGAGFQRGGTQSVARSKRPADRLVGRRPVRRIKPKVSVAGHARAGKQVGPHKRGFPARKPVTESESNAGSATAAYHTSAVNAPLGYQRLFQ